MPEDCGSTSVRHQLHRDRRIDRVAARREHFRRSPRPPADWRQQPCRGRRSRSAAAASRRMPGAMKAAGRLGPPVPGGDHQARRKGQRRECPVSSSPWPVRRLQEQLCVGAAAMQQPARRPLFRGAAQPGPASLCARWSCRTPTARPLRQWWRPSASISRVLGSWARVPLHCSPIGSIPTTC